MLLVLVTLTTLINSYNYYYSRCQQGHGGSKTLRQQNPPFLNWKCWLTQVDLYNGHKTVVVVVVVITVEDRCILLTVEYGV